MSLTAGTRIGSYEVLGSLGAGGMAEVYRARDTRLGRDVAIKILPELWASDAERLARFDREAHVLAALNHPHISAIYGIEDGASTPMLVLELVEGGTLADRLKESPIPLSDSLTIARQIADALDAAHQKGIIHRDLKPANIAVAPDLRVKVLDFGLAKLLERADPGGVTLAETTAGTFLGTVAYMSPEQARGRPVDKQSDIWAFGCVLFEMLTGRHPFSGETVSDTIAAILERDPDWSLLPSAAFNITPLLRRCLEKDLPRRLHDIADARIEIDDALTQPKASSPARDAGQATPTLGRIVPWLIASAALLALAASLMFRASVGSTRTETGLEPYSASIGLPEGVQLSAVNPAGRFALSPDGRRLAIAGTDSAGKTLLWIRALDSVIARPLPGTEGAAFPFWSPDSRFVAFLAQGKLKKIDIAGGVPVTLAAATLGATGTWSRDDVILFTPEGSQPIYRVSASGGTPVAVTRLDKTAGESQHWYPSFLPDGKHFFFFVVGSTSGGLTDARAIHLGSLDVNEPVRLVAESGSNARYANGHLIYLRNGTLVAQPFDSQSFSLRGEPVPLVEEVQIAGGGSTGVAGAFSVSDTGLLVYQTGLVVRSQLAWFDRSGAELGKLGDRADYSDAVLSPDDKQAAVSVLDPVVGTRDIWIFDVARGLRERLSFDQGDDFAPVWIRPDGNRILYSSRRGGGVDLYQKALVANAREELVYHDALGKFAASSSEDGRYLSYVAGGGIISRSDLWILPLSGVQAKAYPFQEEAFVESQPQISPDGRWVAFMTRETGSAEVYVRPFSGSASKIRVSIAGGGWPRWRRDGRELLYLSPDDKLMSVRVSSQAESLSFDQPATLFTIHPRPQVRLDAYMYDMTKDGKRFLVNTLVEQSVASSISVVINWPQTIRPRKE